jgi:predicted ATPase
MQKEMSILRQLAEEGKITYHDASEMILAMDEAERRSVWEEEGEFDPRRFMARLQESPSQTMLNDMIWLERAKLNKELKDKLRSLTGAKLEEFLEKIEALSPADPDQFAENPLMANVDYLRRRSSLDALSTLAAFKHLEDFSGCSALESFDLDRSKKILRDSARQKPAVDELRLSLPMRKGDTLRLHRPNSVEIYQAEGDHLEVIAEKVCWADTEDEARKELEGIEIWTFLEGDRIWIRDSRVQNLLGWPMVNLKLFVPRGAVIDSSYPPNLAGLCDSVQMKDVEANVAACTIFYFSAENVIGSLRVKAESGHVSIKNLDGKAEVEALCGDISVVDSRADLELRSVLGNVTCADLSGACKAKLIQGELTMTNTCTSNLDLSTKGGRITFDGVVMGGMSHNIKSESGDIEVSLDHRSDCSLTAESEKGSVTCTLLEDKPDRKRASGGPNSMHLDFLRGSSSMDVMSRSGNIVIKAKGEEQKA